MYIIRCLWNREKNYLTRQNFALCTQWILIYAQLAVHCANEMNKWNKQKLLVDFQRDTYPSISFQPQAIKCKLKIHMFQMVKVNGLCACTG